MHRMGRIARYLNQLTIGNVFDAPDMLEKYSTDRSALKIRPKIVAVPESTEDVQKLMRFCYQLASKGIKIPVTVRGSGLDEMGADLGNSIVISTEKLDHLLESDHRERLVRVQAGITLKELNTALSLNGLVIPIGGHDDDTIGGLISSSPVDDFAGKYGGIYNYVERIEAVLPNGEILQTNRLNARAIAKKAGEKSLESKIYARLSRLIERDRSLIDGIGKDEHNLAGYPGIARASRKKALDVRPLFFGAEGTLGIITEVILRAEVIKPKLARVVATFEDFTTAEKFLELAKSCKPRELNLYDLRIIKTAEESGKKLSEVTRNMEKGFVIFATFDTGVRQALRKIESVRDVLPKQSQLILESPKNDAVLSEFENSLANFLGQVRSGERIPILTDFYVPDDKLASAISDFDLLEKNLKMELAIFGSYGAGVYSLRPKFKLDADDFNKKVLMLIRTGAFIIGRQNGSLAGGGAEGRIKAMITNDKMSEEQKRLYLNIKNTFDRYNIMNPDVKLGANTRYTVRHFRDK